MTTIRRFFEDISGATAVEYGLIVAVLSLVVMASFNNVSNGFENLLGGTANTIESARE